MFNFRSKKILIAALVAIISGLVLFIGCKNDDYTVPAYTPIITSPPLEMTIEQLYMEYMAYGPAAEDKYDDKRLLFQGLTVEKVFSILNSGNETLEKNAYIVADNAMFLPRYFMYTDNIREGFVVDIVGTCNGLIWPNIGEPFLQISDCWISIVEGDIIEDWYNNPEAY